MVEGRGRTMVMSRQKAYLASMMSMILLSFLLFTLLLLLLLCLQARSWGCQSVQMASSSAPLLMTNHSRSLMLSTLVSTATDHVQLSCFYSPIHTVHTFPLSWSYTCIPPLPLTLSHILSLNLYNYMLGPRCMPPYPPTTIVQLL